MPLIVVLVANQFQPVAIALLLLLQLSGNLLHIRLMFSEKNLPYSVQF